MLLGQGEGVLSSPDRSCGLGIWGPNSGVQDLDQKGGKDGKENGCSAL